MKTRTVALLLAAVYSQALCAASLQDIEKKRHDASDLAKKEQIQCAPGPGHSDCTRQARDRAEQQRVALDKEEVDARMEQSVNAIKARLAKDVEELTSSSPSPEYLAAQRKYLEAQSALDIRREQVRADARKAQLDCKDSDCRRAVADKQATAMREIQSANVDVQRLRGDARQLRVARSRSKDKSPAQQAAVPAAPPASPAPAPAKPEGKSAQQAQQGDGPN